MNQLREDDAGFTLIELLVVMVVLGVLAGLAVPTFLSQKEKGYRETVIADARSILTVQTTLLTDDLPATDESGLASAGYRRSDGVQAPVIKLTGSAYLACLKHQALAEWLVLDSTTQATSWAVTSPCD